MKADLAIYTHVLGVPGQYESVALMLSHKMDFNCCANRDGFRKSSHKCYFPNGVHVRGVPLYILLPLTCALMLSLTCTVHLQILSM